MSLVAPLVLVGCAKNNSQSIELASQTIKQSLGCENVKSLTYDSFYELLDQSKSNPYPEDLKMAIHRQLADLQSSESLSSEEKKKMNLIAEQMDLVVDLMLSESVKNPNLSWKEQIQKIIQYEMEDQSSEDLVQTHQALKLHLDQVKQLSSSLSLACETPQAPADTSLPAAGSTGGAGSAGSSDATPTTEATSPVGVAQGLRRVISTAYQSCRVLDLPALDKNAPNVVGITRLAEKHPDGIGAKRIISDLASVQKTHYYIRGLATESSCQPVRDNPLIYDYGGEPAISKNTLNFFSNAGTGTAVLGVDCSAFVSSAIAVSGLRYKPDLPNKPIYTRQTSSQFINAAKSGFTCFDNVSLTPNQSILPGDIVAVVGHVVAVDRIGQDPFGLNQLKSVSECSKLNYKNFDIVIAQSSPSKNGIGINKYVVSDYLDESPKMRDAFVKMGVQACLAKFQNKTLQPLDSAWGFIRHKGTASCLATRVAMVGESCTQSCF